MFILLIFELTTAATINSFQLSASSYEIRIKADYFVTFSPPSAVPANGVIVFNFPIEFEDITTSSPRCSFVRNINSAAICTFSTTSVRITGGFPTQISAASNIQFIVSGVVNPQLSSSLTSFQLYTQTSEGTIVDSRTSSSTMTYTAKKLSEVIITPTSNVNGDYTTWTISTTLTYTVLSGGFISLTFPNWNVNLNPSAEQAQSFITSSLTCTGITNMPANLLCSFSSNMLRITMNQDTVGSLVFSIGPVRNPPNTKPVTGFYMSAGQTAGLSEDTTSVSISVTSSLPGLLYDASVKFNDGNSKVNAQSVYAFDFFNKNPIPSNSNLQITFPSDISVVGFVSSITSIFGFDAPSPSFTLTNQVLVITSPFLQYEVENKEINFLVDNCKNPPSSKLTDSIQIVIITSDGFLIDQVTTGLGIQAVPGTAAITSIVPTDYKINALTTYTFTFNSNESILAGCAVKIIAPSQISISDRSAGSCTSIIRGFGSSALCSVAENKNIFVTNGFLSDFGTGSIAFSLNGITNPNTINPTSTFTLQVYIDSNFQYLVSEITDKTITATPGALQSVIIQPSSDVTGEITTYTFTIVTSNTILVGGIM